MSYSEPLHQQAPGLLQERILEHSSSLATYACLIANVFPLTTFQLPYRVRWQDLKDLFRKAGTVLRADVSLGPDNRSRGYGTVLLATAEDAGKATGKLSRGPIFVLR